VSEYRLDRTAFKAQSFAEADDHYSYWKDRFPEERLRDLNDIEQLRKKD
jgi:hypothetical protein